jgi:hypothetical protein
LVQKSELGIEAAEKRLAGIWQIFGLETEEEKAANFFETFAYKYTCSTCYYFIRSANRNREARRNKEN